MTNKKPTVSVLIPVFNAGAFLVPAIESILNQSLRNLEIIAIDDGSTDNSFAILKNFARKDKRLRVHQNKKNRNIANTLNRAIKLAKGKYLARMDADDIASKNRLRLQIEYLKSHPTTVILGGQCQTIDIEGKVLGHKNFPTTDSKIKQSLFEFNPIQHPTIVINKKLLPDNFKFYDPTLPPAEDLDMYFRLAKYGKFANLKQYVLKYRQYLGSETFKNPVKTFGITLKVRNLAVSQYGYRPTLKSKLVNLIQRFIIKILPDFLIYPLYAISRGMESPMQPLHNHLMLNLNRAQSSATI